MNTAEYPMVYRHGELTERLGTLCRIVAFGERQTWMNGKVHMGVPSDSVAIEFEDGARAEVIRNAVIRARSRLGRTYVRKPMKPRTEQRRRAA